MRSVPQMRKVPLGARATFNASFLLSHYARRSERLEAVRERSRRQLADHVRAGGPGRRLEVERRADLSPEAFRADYLTKGIPVVLEGAAASWPLMTEWSFDAFRDRFGDQAIKLVQREGLTDDDVVFEREYSEEIGFGEFLDGVLSGGRRYMRFSPLLEQFPELLDDFDHEYFKRMLETPFGQSFQLFIGGSGSVTPFHNAITPFLFTNVAGEKDWTLIPSRYLGIMNPIPDGFSYNHTDLDLDFANAEDYPGTESIDYFTTTTRPGDLLFVPSWMWHGVRNRSATIGVRCGFMYLPGMAQESLTLLLVRLFAARNPNVFQWFYYSYVNTNLPDRDDHLIHPRWFRGTPAATEAEAHAAPAGDDRAGPP